MQIAVSTNIALDKHKIAFSDWQIPVSERVRISQTPVGIVVFSPPASCIGENELSRESPINSIIVLDMSYLNSGYITPSEQVGIILHELGHLLNLPKNDSLDSNRKHAAEEEELYADYYAAYCGYGTEFANAMTKMKEANVYGFDKPDIQRRIDELAKPSKIRLAPSVLSSSDP